VESSSQRNGLIYVAWRAVPVFLVGVLVANASNRSGNSPWLGLGVLLVMHLATTNLRISVIRGLAVTPRWVRGNHTAFHALVSLAVMASTTAAGFAWPMFDALMPDPDELVQALWTAIFIGIAATIVRVSSTYRPTVSNFARAKRDLGDELLDFAHLEAHRHDVSARFILAIVRTECLNRPRWFRKLERFKGKISGPGTYGVAQMASKTPISDEESIIQLCRKFSGFYPVWGEYEINRTLLTIELERHNNGSAFIRQAINFFDELDPRQVESSDRKNRDGRGVVEVLPLKRSGEMWNISFSVDPEVNHLLMQLLPRDGAEAVTHRLLSPTPLQDGRRTYEVSVPIKEVARGVIVALSETGEAIGDVALDLNDPWWQTV
jgi:hypothetical protein